MTRRQRHVAVVLAFLAVLALGITATGGFSSVRADRGVDVAVVPDDDAFLGVEVDETEGEGRDAKAISFVGFCVAAGQTEVDSTVTVTEYKTGSEGEDDPTAEALAVRWSTDDPVSTVVLKTGGGPDEFERFDVDGATDGIADVQGGVDAALRPDSYCPDGQHEAGKLEADDGEFDLADSATPVGDSVAVTVTNRFDEPLTTVEVSAAGVTRTLADADETDLGVGESVTLALPADCETVTVVAEGEGTAVNLTRDCP